MKLVYNPTRCKNEKMVNSVCPRCKGFGSNRGDNDNCHICKGRGRIWHNKEIGLTLPLYSRDIPVYY